MEKRKIHFLIEFAWNFRIYSDLFKIAKKFKINQLDIILNFLKNGKKDSNLVEFWKLFDEASKNECETMFYPTSVAQANLGNC